MARWDNLRDQISAGLNTGLSGLPNWTHDIGGFSVEARYSTPEMAPADRAEWDELNLRWFQFGAWTPIFRSHGEFPLREVYNLAEPGTPLYAAYADALKIRYRLMPYIYSVAGDTYHRDGTIMRGLVMDFPNDLRARAIDDQYMFGPALLVAPVTAYQARERTVYFPGNATWYDLRSGQTYRGGTEATVAAPLDRVPVFVRAGSIVPAGPDIQYTGEKPDGPIHLVVYTGADGRFVLYEDAGLTYGYERGEFSTIPIQWNEADGVLSIGARTGTYPGMVATRTVTVRFVSGADPAVGDFDAAPARTLQYEGHPITLER